MVKRMSGNNVPAVAKNYKKMGVVAAAVVAIAALGVWGINAMNRGGASVEESLASVSTEYVTGADLHIAVIRMDAIQIESEVLKNLRKQKESFENKLKDQLTTEQKALEKEKAEIEKSQDVLSREALARRVSDYQGRVNKLQRDLNERAQSIEVSFQKALADIQEKHLDPLIEGIIAKKNLSVVLDGRFARIGNVPNLDITKDVISALDKRVTNVKMETPKGF